MITDGPDDEVEVLHRAVAELGLDSLRDHLAFPGRHGLSGVAVTLT